eukprot:PhF_6_TR24770/c0_g1_i1/m.34010
MKVEIANYSKASSSSPRVSSPLAMDYRTARRNKMESVNPLFILRNWVLQEAIASAEKGDYSRVQELCDLVGNPYHGDVLAAVATSQNTVSGSVGDVNGGGGAGGDQSSGSGGGAAMFMGGETRWYGKKPEWA